jgi:hypothetical protein
MLRARKLDVATRLFDKASFNNRNSSLALRVLDEGTKLCAKDLNKY